MNNITTKKDQKGNTVLIFCNLRFLKFPDKKPADYKKCRMLVNFNNEVYVAHGYRYSTGFGREWSAEEKRKILFDEHILGWWYESK